MHLNSNRSENNFIIVDCSAVKESIADSMLFGHKKGALPGAVRNRTGLITRADKGTLFLDEVSELPLPAQASLLRVMESRAVIPLGAEMEKTSNFRVIASTSKDLDRLGREGKFHKELLLILKGVCIHLPPLRQIQADAVKIALYDIDRSCKKCKIDTKGVSPEFLDILTAYEWPGNVAELTGAMDKAVASAKK
nr:sigma-54-dependent Fis family transcriptional regulator [Desulfobacula sp.]